jgi:hypothetical protein
MGKRGYFFTLDAFIAMGIITTGLVLVYLSQTLAPPTVQAEFLSQDVMETLASTQLFTLNNPYVDEHRTSRNITDLDNTILEQIGEFYVTQQLGNAQNLTRNVTLNLIPPQYSFEIWFDGWLVHNRSYLHSDETPVLSASKTMVIGVINRTFFWGPYTAEVYVWQ